MRVYIVTEKLRVPAETMICFAKQATGFKEAVEIESYDYNILTSTYSANANITFSNPGVLTCSAPPFPPNGVTITTSGNYGGGGGVWSSPQPQTTTVWSGNTFTVPPQVLPLGPPQIEEAPAKDQFEKMVRTNIQLLNDAYLLGRSHGRLDGIKEGAEQITRTLDDIMDTEILKETEQEATAI